MQLLYLLYLSVFFEGEFWHTLGQRYRRQGYSCKAEEDFPKVSDTTEAKAMLDTVREFCNRFFSLLRCTINFCL